MTNGSRPLLAARDVIKRYPGVNALSGVNFDLYPGEVHALLGENGAGKSTLVKILTGVEQADEGHVLCDGELVQMHSPRDARDLGIAVIYQEISQELVPTMTAAENIFLGREPIRPRTRALDRTRLNAEARSLLARLGIDPAGLEETPLSEFGVGEQQTVAIAKALSVEARILVMDEPSAALSRRETDALFKNVRALRDEGVGIIYISHRLEEIFEIADRVTVLRDGKVAGTAAVSTVEPRTLVRMMVGHDLEEQFPWQPAECSSAPVVEVRHLSGAAGKFQDISFEIHGGETLGIYGITGCGNRHLIRALFGLEAIEDGEVLIHGRRVDCSAPRGAIEAGVAFVSDDRKIEGLLLERSVRENVSAPILRSLTSLGFVQRAREVRLAHAQVQELDIRTPSIEQVTRYLSGGNQQKVVLAKWLSTRAHAFLFNEPTRGIDVGAKVEIYRLINALKAEGACVLIVSSELPEMIGITDRLLVMREGVLVSEVDPRGAGVSQTEVFALANGEAPSDVH